MKTLTPAMRAQLLRRPLQRRVVEAIQERAQAGESVADLAEDFVLSRSVIRRLIALGRVR